VYDKNGKKIGEIELHYSPSGYTIEKNCIYTPYGMRCEEWPSTPQQDKQLVELWKELERLRRKGEIPSWIFDKNIGVNPCNTCWWATWVHIDWPDVKPRPRPPWNDGVPICFVSSVGVRTPRGMKPISEIKVDDLVMSFDCVSGKYLWKSVSAISSKWSAGEFAKVRFSNSVVAVSTSSHPYLVRKRGDGVVRPVPRTLRGGAADTANGVWVEARDLRPGDELMSPEGAIRVIGLELFESSQEVFNLEVEGTETFVIEAGVVVHNS
jgi:hypothetical protein